MQRRLVSKLIVIGVGWLIFVGGVRSAPSQAQSDSRTEAPARTDMAPQWFRDSNVHRRAAPADSTPLAEWDMAPANSSTTPVAGYFFINTNGSEYGNANAVFSQVQATNFAGVTQGGGPVANNSNCMLAGEFAVELPKCWGMLGEAQTLPSGWTGTAGQMFGVVGQVNGFNKTGNGTIRTAAAIAGYTISSYSGTKIQKAVSLYGVAPNTGNMRFLLDLMDSSQSKDIFTVTPNGPGNDTYGEKHVRFGSTCTTGAQAGSTCKTEYAWSTPFVDRNYTPVCWGMGPKGAPVLNLETSQQPGTITVDVMAVVDKSSSFSGVYCIAMHDP